MDDPEQPLGRVFDDLEAEFEAGLRHEADQEAAAAVRAGVGETVLWQQLARLAGAEVTVRCGGRVIHGLTIASYPDFFVVRAGDAAEHLVPFGPAVSVSLPAAPPRPRPVPAAPLRWRLALALRELARRREPVRVDLADGGWLTGTIESVGSDYLEVAEHDLGEPRRRPAVKARRLLGFAAIALVTLPPAPPDLR
ncbi:MAG TPA: hypothetical protein VFD04_04860 [Actinomycetes bacterium]|jgi:hypothetical protein|nr:hypothetical protein [Actinomycetes bacterium]